MAKTHDGHQTSSDLMIERAIAKMTLRLSGGVWTFTGDELVKVGREKVTANQQEACDVAR